MKTIDLYKSSFGILKTEMYWNWHITKSYNHSHRWVLWKLCEHWL